MHSLIGFCTISAYILAYCFVTAVFTTIIFQILNSYLKIKVIPSRSFPRYQICRHKTTGRRLKLAKQKMVDPHSIPYIPRR